MIKIADPNNLNHNSGINFPIHLPVSAPMPLTRTMASVAPAQTSQGLPNSAARASVASCVLSPNSANKNPVNTIQNGAPLVFPSVSSSFSPNKFHMPNRTNKLPASREI